MLKKDRKYYRIGQVSKMVGVKPHVLRFWESQFRHIQPRRISRQRLYRGRDVKILKRIKTLLYDEGYTIAGARKKIREEFSLTYKGKVHVESVTDEGILKEIRRELLEIREILSRNHQ